MTSAMDRCCLSYWIKSRERLTRYLAMEPMTKPSATRQLANEKPKRRFHRAEGRRFGDMAIAKERVITEMRTCVVCAKWDARLGKRRVATIVGR